MVSSCLKALPALRAGATAWFPMVRALTTQGGLQPTGWPPACRDWGRSPALRGRGPLQGPEAHPAQTGLAHQWVTCQVLILEGNSPDTSEGFLTCLGESLSRLPWTKAARTTDSSGRVQVWLLGSWYILASLWEWWGPLFGLKWAYLLGMGYPVLPHTEASVQVGGFWRILGSVRDGRGKCVEGMLDFLPWEWGCSLGPGRLGWVCSLGERRVGGFLEEWGCVMSTWISPKSRLSHPHQPVPLTEGTFLSAIVVLSSIPGLRPSLAPYYSYNIGPAPQPGKWDLWGSCLVNPSRSIPWFCFSYAGHLTRALHVSALQSSQPRLSPFSSPSGRCSRVTTLVKPPLTSGSISSTGFRHVCQR